DGGVITPTVTGNVSVVSGKNGPAWEFGAGGGYISIPSVRFGSTEGFSVFMKVKFLEWSGDRQYVIAAPSGSPSPSLNGGRYEGTGRALFNYGNGAAFGDPLPLNQWVTVGMIRDHDV